MTPFGAVRHYMTMKHGHEVLAIGTSPIRRLRLPLSLLSVSLLMASALFSYFGFEAGIKTLFAGSQGNLPKWRESLFNEGL